MKIIDEKPESLENAKCFSRSRRLCWVWDVDGVERRLSFIADTAFVHNIVNHQSRYYNVTIAIAFSTIRIHDTALHNSHNSRVNLNVVQHCCCSCCCCWCCFCLDTMSNGCILKLVMQEIQALMCGTHNLNINVNFSSLHRRCSMCAFACLCVN